METIQIIATIERLLELEEAFLPVADTAAKIKRLAVVRASPQGRFIKEQIRGRKTSVIIQRSGQMVVHPSILRQYDGCRFDY